MRTGGGIVAAALALGGVAAAGKDQGRVNLLFPAQWTPAKVVASVVEVEPTATTFALDCPPKATDDCSLLVRTMTQGPRTWAYGGEWDDIMGVDEYTLRNECDVRQKNDRMVCTLGVTQVKGGRTASTEIVSTTTGLSDFVYPIPVTAGAHKLEDHKPKPTRTKSSESVPSSTTMSSITSFSTSTVESPTALPTLNLAAADVTKDAASEKPAKESGSGMEDLVEGTPTAVPSTVPTAAASVSRVNAGVVGLAALVGVLAL